ncbi:MAG: GNAT family N-acetyltransferase [Propionibacteriaceae bacterium]|nr:GNAT family N-acetyltransferase [Propionibacteriaceae bacterium]
MLIRPATLADAPAVTAIYNAEGVATTASYDLEPVSVAERERYIAEHLDAGLPFYVAEDATTVVGYACYGGFRVKPGYRYSVEHSVYVASSHRGRGVGRALLSELIATARAAGLHVMVAVIDAANSSSVAFHAGFGFEAAGIWPEICWKFGAWHDVAVMTLKLGDAVPEPGNVIFGG